jgi:voltage-gated potassium channel
MVTNICLVIVNWEACAWVMIEPSQLTDHVTIYNKALYWAITTLTTVGYGDITPSGNVARVYTMIVMVAGVGLYGLIIGQMSSLILQSDKRKEANREKLEALTSLLNYYSVPASVQDQAFDFYRHVLVKQTSEAEEKVLKELPSALQAELQIYMNIKPLRGVSLFQNVSDSCLKSIATELKQVYYSPGDKIIEAGDVGKELFVIGHGQVRVHLKEFHIADLSDGQCFGEMALIGDNERKADVTAVGYCDLFVLEKESFDDLLVLNDDLKCNIESVVAKRDEENKKNATPLSQSPKKID